VGREKDRRLASRHQADWTVRRRLDSLPHRNKDADGGVLIYVFGALVRHFFGRFFDTESLSPQGEPEAGVIQTLGILAAPGGFFVLLFRPLTLTGWSLVAVRSMFVSFSMIVMGFIMVFEWDALFPDRRDYQILTPQPVRLSTLFLGKAAALGIFLAIFLVDVNFFSVLMWPGVDGGQNVMGILSAHVLAVLASGLFMALAAAALQGILITLFRGRVYRRISVAVQTLLMAVLVMLLFLTPLLAFGIQDLAKSGSRYLYWYPGFWFIGFYESIRPATHNATLFHLGTWGTRALWISGAVFLLTFLPGYRRHARRAIETAEPGTVGPGRLARWANAVLVRTILRRPVEYGVFRFISHTITRSLKHRLFLATYGGFGAALAVMTVGAASDGLLRLPLTLSFLLVSGLRAAFNFPSELRANWAFQITEYHGVGEYLAATRKWIVLSAIVPLFLLLAPLEFARFGWSGACFHIVYGLTLSVALMEVLFLGFHKVPFTCARFPGKVNLVGLSVVYILGFTTYSKTMAGVEAWLEQTPAAAAAFFAALWMATWYLSRWRAQRLEALAVLEYEDAGEPVVRTLGLNPQ